MKYLIVVFLFCSLVFSQPDFSSGPAVVAQGNQFLINFTVSQATDVEVAVLDGGGKIVRHLAAGVLGGQNDPPLPLQPGLSQSITWDGLDDAGGFGPDNFKVRVRLGVAPVYDTTFDAHDIWPAHWQYYPGNLDPQDTYRPADQGFLNLLSYTGLPLYEQEPRLEISASELTDILLVDGCSSGQGHDKSSASVFKVDGKTGEVLQIINGNNLDFGANAQYPGQGKAVYTLDGKYYLYRCALHVYRFDLEGNPAPWPGTGSHIVENLPYSDIGAAGITPGYDGSVYVVHYGDSTTEAQCISKIQNGVIVTRGIIQANASLAGGVRVDRDGNIYVGARVKELGKPWPDFVDSTALGGTMCDWISQKSWAYEVYGSVLKFGPNGGLITANSTEPNVIGGMGYHRLNCDRWDQYRPSKATGMQWMHYGMSHILLHVSYSVTHCWCAQTRFDIDDYGRIYYPNTFMSEFCGIDNSRNYLFRIKNRDIPEVAIGVGHQIEATDKALFVADFYNTQIIRFNWQADKAWESKLKTRLEGGALPAVGLEILNYPNPFNQNVKIAVSHQSRPGGTVSKIDLGIYDINGKLVEKLTAGTTWNAQRFPAGIYIIKLNVGKKVLTKRIILQK